MTRIAIITSSRKGSASFFLPYLIASPGIDIAKVIVGTNAVQKRGRLIKRKVNKILKIGLGGAINGVRMRKWFNEDVNAINNNSDIKEICKTNNIPYCETESINNDFTRDQLELAKADIGISLGNGYITSKIFSIPRCGMINVHGEVLPQFQNAQSVIWQLYKGSKETGYTIHRINKGIDTGDIIKQEVFPIILKEKLSETISYSCAEIQKKAALGMVEVLNNLDTYLATAIEQGSGNSYTTPSLYQFIRILINHKRLYDQSRNA